MALKVMALLMVPSNRMIRQPFNIVSMHPEGPEFCSAKKQHRHAPRLAQN